MDPDAAGARDRARHRAADADRRRPRRVRRGHASRRAPAAARRRCRCARGSSTRLLGVALPRRAGDAARCSGLQMQVTPNAEGWQVTPPAYRFDIAIEADLIEEVARIVGFEAIPGDRRAARRSVSAACRRAVRRSSAVLEALAARGYQEAITFAFVDPGAAGAAVSRTPGAWRCPIRSPATCRSCACRCGRGCCARRWRISAASRIASGCSSTARASRRTDGSASARWTRSPALPCGPRLPEQWGVAEGCARAVDFYDVKGDLRGAARGDRAARESFTFRGGSAVRACTRAAPRACCARGRPVGWLGELHPTPGAGAGFYICTGAVRAGLRVALR